MDFGDGSFVIVIFMAIYAAGLITFQVLEVRTRPPKVGSRDYWVQQEIDQTMEWWDREFAILSGLSENSAAIRADAFRAEREFRAKRPVVGPKGPAGDSGANQAYELPAPIYNPTKWRETPTYALSHRRGDEYVMVREQGRY